MASAPMRTAARAAVLLLALYLAVDIATPLLPGAFRFDVNQSIEAARGPGNRVVLGVVDIADAADSDRVVRPVSSQTLRPARRQHVAVRVGEEPRPARTDAASDTFEDD
ncbi:MAG: hypothetical protein ACREJV_14505 [Candidatus Rokuibacteriota bacterium]